MMKPRYKFSAILLVISVFFLISCGDASQVSDADTATRLEPESQDAGEQMDPEELVHRLRHLPSWIQVSETAAEVTADNAQAADAGQTSDGSQAAETSQAADGGQGNDSLDNAFRLSYEPYTFQIRPDSRTGNLPPEIREELVITRLRQAGEDPLLVPAYPPALIAGKLLSLSPNGQVFYLNLLSDESGVLNMPAGGVNAFGVLADSEMGVISTVNGQAAVFFLGGENGPAAPLSAPLAAPLWRREYPAAIKYLGAMQLENLFGAPGDAPGQNESLLLLFLGEGGWFSLVDAHTGREYYRSLGQGKALAGAYRSGRVHALFSDGTYRSFSISQMGEEEFAPETVAETEVDLPFPDTRSMIDAGGALVFATDSFSTVSEATASEPSYVYGYNPETGSIRWVRSFPGRVLLSRGRAQSGKNSGSLLVAHQVTGTVLELDADEGLPLSAYSIPEQISPKRPSEIRTLLEGMLMHKRRRHFFHPGTPSSDPSFAVLQNSSVTPGEVPPLSGLDVDWSSHDLILRAMDVSGEGEADSADFSGLNSEFSLRIQRDDLPLRLPFTPDFPVSGLLRSESKGEILITIEDERGSELLSSLDKVSLQPELRYDLRPGRYWIVLRDAGGVEDGGADAPDSRVLVLRNIIF
ncbi:hypothetical protein [Salinispira pacifica]|nr:hypothetical protein [Salinispira pacifica]